MIKYILFPYKFHTLVESISEKLPKQDRLWENNNLARLADLKPCWAYVGDMSHKKNLHRPHRMAVIKFRSIVMPITKSRLFCWLTVWFSFIVFMFVPDKLTLSVHTRSLCVPFNFRTCRFTEAFLMSSSKSKLKSNRNNGSPCFRPLWIAIILDKCLLIQNLQWHLNTF